MSDAARNWSSEFRLYGDVLEVRTREVVVDYGHEVQYAAKVKVFLVEKGEGLSEGEVITVTYRRLHTDRPGPVGQNIPPQEGDSGKFFLNADSDGNYQIIEPNGWDKAKTGEL